LAFLLRHGKRYDGKSKWTQAHHRWLEGVKFEQATQQIVFQEYVDTVAVLSKRLDALDGHLQSAASASVFWPVIEALMALRGVNLLTAATIVAEIGDLKRFASAPQLMAYLGVVPSEHSSGGSTSRGGITKAGNGHVRRVLVEAAWTYRHPARKTAVLQRCAERHPAGRSGHCVEGANALVRALPYAGGPRQAQSAGLHGNRARIGRFHLGDWARITAACGKSVKENHDTEQCVGSRMDNGGRILEAAMRHPATE
jgi:transposase